MILADFSSLDAAKEWFSINDNVMGGLSRGRMTISPLGFGVFSGHISLANGGGFAAVRTNLESTDLSEFTGIYIEIHGDAKRVKLNLKDDLESDSCVYQASFNVTEQLEHRAYGTWQKILLPFERFVARRRGIGLHGYQIDLSHIKGVGLVVGNGQSGDFCLNVRTIGAYR